MCAAPRCRGCREAPARGRRARCRRAARLCLEDTLLPSRDAALREWLRLWGPDTRRAPSRLGQLLQGTVPHLLALGTSAFSAIGSWHERLCLLLDKKLRCSWVLTSFLRSVNVSIYPPPPCAGQMLGGLRMEQRPCCHGSGRGGRMARWPDAAVTPPPASESQFCFHRLPAPPSESEPLNLEEEGTLQFPGEAERSD